MEERTNECRPSVAQGLFDDAAVFKLVKDIAEDDVEVDEEGELIDEAPVVTSAPLDSGSSAERLNTTRACMHASEGMRTKDEETAVQDIYQEYYTGTLEHMRHGAALIPEILALLPTSIKAPPAGRMRNVAGIFNDPTNDCEMDYSFQVKITVCVGGSFGLALVKRPHTVFSPFKPWLTD
jgi:hypothetical protein